MNCLRKLSLCFTTKKQEKNQRKSRVSLTEETSRKPHYENPNNSTHKRSILSSMEETSRNPHFENPYNSNQRRSISQLMEETSRKPHCDQNPNNSNQRRSILSLTEETCSKPYANNSVPRTSERIKNKEEEISLEDFIVIIRKSLLPVESETTKKKSVENKFVCEICVEKKKMNEVFNIKGCSHSFCSECIVRYVASKIQENVISIGCPEMNCQGVLEPEFCRSVLPLEVYDRWGKALCESLVLAPHKFYCPFKDCSALLVDDGDGGILESECPHCNRLFCAQCKVPWHAGIICADFQKLNVDERGNEDIMLMTTAKKNKWQRCPKCKFYVERTEGCLFIKCRCGHAFCYNCAAPMVNHRCRVCQR